MCALALTHQVRVSVRVRITVRVRVEVSVRVWVVRARRLWWRL